MAENMFTMSEDLVKVVRCKDCKWYRKGTLIPWIKFCYRLKDDEGEQIGYNFAADDFCSYGERRVDHG